jgi:hypothetical protein
MGRKLSAHFLFSLGIHYPRIASLFSQFFKFVYVHRAYNLQFSFITNREDPVDAIGSDVLHLKFIVKRKSRVSQILGDHVLIQEGVFKRK